MEDMITDGLLRTGSDMLYMQKRLKNLEKRKYKYR